MPAPVAVLFVALLDVQGYVAARGVSESGSTFLGATQLGLEWSSEHFTAHVSGAAYNEDAGLVEAYVEARYKELQLRAGQFFLPSSRENKDELWTSPYTINFSALNTWIAEEVRPVGVDLQWRHELVNLHSLTLGATAFRGNDSMGALLGWRGWNVGNRLATYNEVLPLPPLPELQTFFREQRDDGTQPFGRDLDGNTGYAARVRYSIPERANVQYAYVDNRGDRALHRGEYAWSTSFHLAGLELGNPDRAVFAAEYMNGTTGMGVPPAFVDAGFYAAYALVSGKVARSRLTARFDWFATTEQDFSPADRNDESGRAWTLSYLHDITQSMRAAVEFTRVAGHRGAVSKDRRSVTLEARYRF